MTDTTATYRIEFGPAWPVPPITVDFTDRTQATRAVAKHAIPHLAPVLAEKGHPEYADCFFRTDRDLTEGSFMWIDLVAGMSATFCPARLTAVSCDRCKGSGVDPEHTESEDYGDAVREVSVPCSACQLAEEPTDAAR